MISRAHGLPVELEATFQSCQTYVDIFKCNKVFGPKEFQAFYLQWRKFEEFIRDSLEDSSRAKRYQYTPSFESITFIFFEKEFAAASADFPRTCMSHP